MRKLVLGLMVAAALAVSATAASAAVVAQDGFERSVTGGWGSAPVGGAWTRISGAATAFAVTGGRGTITHPAAGSNLLVGLNGVSTLNADATLLVTADQPGGSNLFVYLEARRSGTSAYRLGLRVAADGRVFFRGSRVVANVETGLGTEQLASGVTAAGGMRVRAQVEGSSPTTLRMKVWSAAGSEPAGWQFTATDATGPQAAGTLGVRTYLSGSVTNAPRAVRVDDLAVDDLAGTPPVGDPVLLGAGDIAYTENGDTLTAAIVNANPGALVYTTGDNAYPNGSAANFATYYEPTWGAFKARTRFPVTGNHEYDTANAAGHYGYFGAAAHGPLGYWSDDTVSPSWHVIVLNSNCSFVSCAANSAQLNWLRADLAANTRPCTVALWHHPRFSSGEHGNDATVAAFWDELYAAGAELVLNGHDHDYERFNPQTPAAVASPIGIQQFIVGTGGRVLRSLTSLKANSARYDATSWGVLQLTLHEGSYDYEFLRANGSNDDAGTRACHSAPVFATDLGDRTDVEGDVVSLDADATDAQGETLTYSATGLPQDVTIAPSTGVISGTLSGSSAGSYAVTVTVSDGTATDTDTFTWTVEADGGEPNAPPVVDSVQVTPASPTTGQTLTASVTSHDDDGDTLTTAYQWTRNGTDIAGATGSTLDLAVAGNGDEGDAIRVRVTVSDGQDPSAPVTSDAVTVANSAPTATVSVAPSAPTTNATLTATATKADPDAGDAVGLTYTWRVDGTVRQTTTTTALTDGFDLSLAGNGDPGQTVSVTVVPNDGTTDGAPSSAQVTVASAVTVYADDAFARTSTNTWGSAPTGGAYTLQGTAADYDVAGGVGTMVMAAGSNRSAILAGVSALDAEVSFRVATDRAAVGAQQYAYGVVRRVSSTTEYRFMLRFAPNGAVFMQAAAVVDNVTTAAGSEVQVPGLTRSPGQFVRVRAQVQGASPTTLRMRAWADGGTEPATWQYAATNATAGVQVAGGIGLRSYVGSATTNGPVLVSFDDLRATSIAP